MTSKSHEPPSAAAVGESMCWNARFFEAEREREAAAVREAEAARPTPKKLSESDNVLIRLLAKLGIGLKGVWDMLPG